MDALKLKTALSVLIVAAGIMTVPLLISDSDASEPQAPGFLIDFGNWDVAWTKMDIRAGLDPYEALEAACEDNDFTFTIEGDAVTEINGVFSTDVRSWNLWTISKNSLKWVKEPSPQSIDLYDYTVAAWAYGNDDEVPTIAVDETGQSIYGYQQAQRTITLSPALTEIMGSLRAVATLVGTDRYSTHPDSVIAGQAEGKIKIVGDFLNPSFELIIGQKPDIVFCDGSLYSHHEMVNRLRSASVNTVLMYGGESIQEIMSNIYIVGVSIGYDIRADEVIDLLESAQEEITDALSSNPYARDKDAMIALSPDKSPWVTGSETFVDDVSSSVSGKNIFTSYLGWVHINSELVMASNPSTIIILTYDYKATQEEYDTIIGSLSAEWRATDAYKNGNIYVVCEDAGVMSQCPSPRFIQLMEITARIMHPDVFTDTEMPKFIGDDYENYLTFTKYLGFNE